MIKKVSIEDNPSDMLIKPAPLVKYKYNLSLVRVSQSVKMKIVKFVPLWYWDHVEDIYVIWKIRVVHALFKLWCIISNTWLIVFCHILDHFGLVLELVAWLVCYRYWGLVKFLKLFGLRDVINIAHWV